MRRFLNAGGLLAALILCGAHAAAAKPTEAQLDAIKANCRSDFMSNCWGVPRGGVEAMQCLKEHMASLSPGVLRCLFSHKSDLTPDCQGALAKLSN